MSMHLCLVTLSDANIQRVLKDPPLIWLVVAPDDPERYLAARSESKKVSWLPSKFRKEGPEKDGCDLELSPGEGIVADLDKSWHGLHYLLTRTAWEGTPPLDFLVRGGTPVGNIDIGYGPARVFTAAETRAIYQALTALGDDALRSRFNPLDMTGKEIYPETWERDSRGGESLEYLMGYIAVARSFLKQAVSEKVGIVVDLS
jgi:hypothetical protein